MGASHTVGTVTSTVPTVTPIRTPELSGVRSGGVTVSTVLVTVPTV